MGAEARANPFATWKRTEGVRDTEAYDCSGRLLQVGDVVHLVGKHDVMWRVSSVRPILDARVPPGTVELSLTTAFVTGIPGGRPIADVLKIIDAGEIPVAQGGTKDAPAEEEAAAPSGLIVP
jgi:hypothetical protein